MKIAVISSNGKAEKLIVKEALNQGLDVTGIARGENKSDADSFIQKDIFDLTTDDIEGFDVLVDAFGTFTPDTLSQHETTLAHLSDLVSGTSARLIVVGGAGSLYLDKDHTQQLKDSPDFPDLFKPLASVMSQALDELRTRDDVNWTYISPAADFQFDEKKQVTTAYQVKSFL